MVSNDVLARMCNTQCPPTGHEEKKANLNRVARPTWKEGL